MGTYTQPSQVLDKAHSQIQEGFTSLTSTIQDQIDANRKEKKKELAAIEKQKKLNGKELEWTSYLVQIHNLEL